MNQTLEDAVQRYFQAFDRLVGRGVPHAEARPMAMEATLSWLEEQQGNSPRALEAEVAQRVSRRTLRSDA
jgi:hypothetical protein